MLRAQARKLGLRKELIAASMRDAAQDDKKLLHEDKSYVDTTGAPEEWSRVRRSWTGNSGTRGNNRQGEPGRPPNCLVKETEKNRRNKRSRARTNVVRGRLHNNARIPRKPPLYRRGQLVYYSLVLYALTAHPTRNRAK